MSAQPHVGTLREKPLHAALKQWCARPGDRIEVPVDGFVIDLVRDDGLLVEIQTRGFGAMKRKLAALLEGHAVHVVHPIAVERTIVKIGDGGEVLSRRRSPKRGTALDVFAELVSWPQLVAHPGLTLEVLLTREEEVRRFDGTKAWRRKGWVVDERRLVEVVDRVAIDSPASLARLLPIELPLQFTTADLATAVRRPRRLAQQMTFCLRHAGVIDATGKQGNAVVYTRTGDSASYETPAGVSGFSST